MPHDTPEEIPESRIAVLPDGNIAVQDGDELVIVDLSEPYHPSIAARGDVEFDFHGRLDVGDGSVLVIDPTDPDLPEWVGDRSRSKPEDDES